MKEGTFICQTKYVKDMLKKFDMADAKPIKTPMALNGHIDLNEEGKSVDQKVYHSMISSLLYLCASRPHIMLSVCMCERFQANPKECHFIAVKRILIYLVHTPNLVWQNQIELYRLKYASPFLRAPTCFRQYNPLACRVTSR
jgi:hypothetical protein